MNGENNYAVLSINTFHLDEIHLLINYVSYCFIEAVSTFENEKCIPDFSGLVFSSVEEGSKYSKCRRQKIAIPHISATKKYEPLTTTDTPLTPYTA